MFSLSSPSDSQGERNVERHVVIPERTRCTVVLDSDKKHKESDIQMKFSGMKRFNV